MAYNDNSDPYNFTNDQPQQQATSNKIVDPAYSPNPVDPNDPAYLNWQNQQLAKTQVANDPNDTNNTPDWQKYLNAATQQPTPPAASSSTPSGPTGTVGSLLSPFTETFTPPTPQAYQPAPTFNAPTYKPPPAFAAPTLADAENDPGYQFGRDQGEQALTQNKAASGLLNTGGTLKDILAWGQNYATQHYGDLFNRQKSVYDDNYQTQYVDPYKFAYQSALDTFNPTFSAWQTNTAATQRSNENDYANAYNLFNFDYKKWQDQRDSTFDKTFKYVTA